MIDCPVFWDHLPLRQEVPELCHNDFGRAKKLAEGSFLRQRQPDSSTALILDVLANEDKILWRRLRSAPAFVAVHIIGMDEANVRAGEDSAMMLTGEWHGTARGQVHRVGS